jgi:hypothetical protein
LKVVKTFSKQAMGAKGPARQQRTREPERPGAGARPHAVTGYLAHALCPRLRRAPKCNNLSWQNQQWSMCE